MSRPNKPHGPSVLYVTYDGLLEPLGQTQILPYLAALSASGIRIHIVSFEKRRDLAKQERLADLERVLGSNSLSWTRLTYHARPKLVSTVWDLLLGATVAVKLALRRRVKVIHSRSYVAATMSLPAIWVSGARLIFDMRGFWPEERVELGIFRPRGFLFRAVKNIESILIRQADRIVVLTRRAMERLAGTHGEGAGRIVVIPCCVDLRRFSPPYRKLGLAERYSLKGKVVIGNVGAVSRLYLLAEMFRFVFELKCLERNLAFVYLTRQNPTLLRRLANEAGLADDDLLVTEASPEEIPQWMSLFQLGVFFPRPCPATEGMCPTKLGEFLAAGVPPITTANVGDVGRILDEAKLGIVLHGFSAAEIRAAADRAAALLPVGDDLRTQCRRVAERHFDLRTGCDRYLAMYRDLMQIPENALAPTWDSL